jgi:TM2 domain-containing membrane protein YozV
MKRILLPFFILFICHISLHSQDIRDRDHSILYARYLMETRQYRLAAEELERVDFLSPGDDSIRLSILRAYRLAGDYPSGLNASRRFLAGSGESIPGDFAQEHFRLMIDTRHTRDAFLFLEQDQSLPLPYKANMKLGLHLLEQEWDKAYQFAVGRNDITPGMYQMVVESRLVNYKSPALALGLSAILPGSGKFYTGNWKDGLIALVFVGANAFSSYRGFNKHGIESAYGWIFGGLAAGFYAGNLYGSYQAATRYNQKLNDELLDKVQKAILSEY